MQKVRVPEANRKRESALVWCIGIGGLGSPKMYFQGWTISEAVRRAEQSLARIARELEAVS